jgi:hypothetical protein
MKERKKKEGKKTTQKPKLQSLGSSNPNTALQMIKYYIVPQEPMRPKHPIIILSPTRLHTRETHPKHSKHGDPPSHNILCRDPEPSLLLSL